MFIIEFIRLIEISYFSSRRYESMFSGCINLEFINLRDFKEIGLKDSPDSYQNMFEKVPENVVICIALDDTAYKIYPQIIPGKKCPTIDCIPNWRSRQKKLIYINNDITCSQNCETNSEYKYEYNGKCYNQCPNGYLYDQNNNKMNKCKCELEECLLCPNTALNKSLCTKCNIKYYPKENTPLNIGKYIKCYKNPEGYYLDNNLYKKCYQSCKICNTSGDNINHNC